MRWYRALLLSSFLIPLTGCADVDPVLTPTSIPATEPFSVTVISPILPNSPVSPLPAPTRTPLTLVITPYPTDNPSEEVIITEMFKSNGQEHVVIENNSSVDQMIGGWYLLNPRTSQKFQFPDDLIVPVGGSIRVHSGLNGLENPPTDLYWSEKEMWNASIDVVLLNPAGRVMFWYVVGQ